MFTWGPIQPSGGSGVAALPVVLVWQNLSLTGLVSSADAGATWGAPETQPLGITAWNSYARLQSGRRFAAPNRAAGGTIYNDGAGWQASTGTGASASNTFIKRSGMLLARFGTSDIYRSTDEGTTWTLATSGTIVPQTYSPGAGKFVLVSVSGSTCTIYLSTNGTDSSNSFVFSSVVSIGGAKAWGNNIVMLYSTSGNVPCCLRSTNAGASWSTASAIFSGSWGHTIFGTVDPNTGIILQPVFNVANSKNYLARSADGGATWSAPVLEGGTRQWSSVIWTGNEFVANTSSNTGGTPFRIVSSPDGLTWTDRGPDPLSNGSAQGNGGAILYRDTWAEGSMT